jgi:ribose transport system permease protein
MMGEATKVLTNTLKALILPAALYTMLLIMIPERIGNWNSFIIMLSMSVIPSITACGLSFGAITGIIDFSVGSVVIFSSLVGAVCGNMFGLPGLLLGAIFSGLLLSAIVGGAFRLLRIPSLVVTVGMLMIFEVAGNRFVHMVGIIWPDYSTGYYIQLDQSLTFLGAPPWNFVFLAVVLSVYATILYRTKFSNQVSVVGSDELIARNVGINPMKIKFSALLMGGIFLGLAAVMTAAYTGVASPQLNMTTLGAVFRPLMGIFLALSMQKLVSIPIGIFIGIFSINIIFTGVIAMGWSDNLQNVLLGIFLIAILAFPKVWRDFSLKRQRGKARKAYAASKEGEAGAK